ncbi:hypothetical protein BJ546DRAFT_180991 [Cryomyces antarcticus]|uniref:Succinate dehydrogenase assembly factor 4, mitochondrial n=1 Tax=Cryomyces antarcticus TaxID=329879 RepID=A0ABR0LQC2_9PEZI|nr:hypothetical protein LTR04_003804 [Oleoguttula sp. CCFEE 6159]KAK5201807.1 hypothetical protein LTR16_001390 [Cryomyces antarcticus]
MIRPTLVTRRLRLQRLFSTSQRLPSRWSTGPAPPRLPEEDQKLFEALQKQSTGAFSTPRTTTSATDPAPPTASPSTTPNIRMQINQSPQSQTDVNARVEAKGTGEELHPDVRRGAKPEFEGDRNPVTGEVGGPKNEPLRWGSTAERGDWSYNGRVTDF